MKKIINSLPKVFATILLVGFTYTASSQPPPPPTSGGGSGTGGTSGQRTGAPIGGGLFILLGLATAYGGKKIYDLRKEKLED